MILRLRAGLLLAALLPTAGAQTKVDLRTQGANVDFSSAAYTKPSKAGTDLPSSCSVGETFFKTDAAAGQNWYGCTSANLWTAQGGQNGTSAQSNYAAPFSSQTSVTIPGNAHQLGSANLLVECYDASVPARRVEPDSIGVDPATFDITVRFATPQSGSCVVNGSGGGATNLTFAQIAGTLRNEQIFGGISALKIGAGNVGDQAFGTLANARTDLQAQIDGKAAADHTHPEIISNGSKLADLTVTRTSATVLTIGESCSFASPCNVRFGSTVYAITRNCTATLNSGSGMALIYAGPGGAITVGHGFDVTASAGCSAQTGVTSFPPDGIPLFSWTATNGAWDASGGRDQRAWLALEKVSAGTGTVVIDAGGRTIVQVDSATVATYLSGSAAINFPPIASGSCSGDQTISVPGAATGDGVAAGWPGTLEAGLTGTMRASAPNTVSVRLCNLSGNTIDPVMANFRATIVRSF